MKEPKLLTVPDIMEYFIHKERLPEYFEIDDELINDFESYGLGVKGYDRFVDYFYLVLPEHNKELFDKHKDRFREIHKDRAEAFNRFLSVKENTNMEERVKDTTRDIEDNIIDSSVYYFSDMSYMLKKWHRYKQVYRFHKSLADRLAETNLNGFYPTILENLPFKTFYIDMSAFKIPADLQPTYKDSTPDKNNILLGALVNIMRDDHSGDLETGELCPSYVMHMMLYSQPSRFAWTRYVYRADKKVGLKDGFPSGPIMDSLGDFVPAFLVNAVIYIASNNSDIAPTPKRKAKRNPKINPRKLLLENSIQDWSAGYVIGPKIEKALQEYNTEYEITGTHNAPRPHVRGAHWHHYWTGPKDGERTLILRWVDETLVNCTDEKFLPITERRSKKNS